MTDIRNGVNAGKTVTVHETQITLNGWSGTGYTILDPESGAGSAIDFLSCILKNVRLASPVSVSK